MPSLYEIALMLVRVFAGMNIVIGATCLVGFMLAFVPAVEMYDQSHLLFGVITYLADFGVATLLGGLLLVLFGKRIARYAAKG